MKKEDLEVDQFSTRYNNPYFQANGVTDIATGLTKQFAYSPVFNKNLGSAIILLSGKRKDDYQAAERISGRVHTTKQTVWHHLFMVPFLGTCTMQLVDWNLHSKSCPHAGGCKQWAEKNANRYRINPFNGILTFNDSVVNSEPYAACSLRDFENKYGIKIPDVLKKFYGQDAAVDKTPIPLVCGEEINMDFIAPIDSSLGASIEAMLEMNLGLVGAGETPVPFAGDECGNVFVYDSKQNVYFYDHETDEYLNLNVKLKDIIK